MLSREIIAVCSQINTKHTNTLCGQNVELLLNVKLAVEWALGFKGFNEHTVSFTCRLRSAVRCHQTQRWIKLDYSCSLTLYPAALVAWWESQAARPAQTRPCFRGGSSTGRYTLNKFATDWPFRYVTYRSICGDYRQAHTRCFQLFWLSNKPQKRVVM